MRYSTEPKFRKYATNKYGKKLIDTATKTGIDIANTTSKKVVQKTAKATGDLIGNKTDDKITSFGKSKEKEITKKAEIYVPLEKRQQFIDDVKLFWVRNVIA